MEKDNEEKLRSRIAEIEASLYASVTREEQCRLYGELRGYVKAAKIFCGAGDEYVDRILAVHSIKLGGVM